MVKQQKQKEFRAPRGTHDILPQDQRVWHKIQQEIREISGYYGFERIDTPHFEDAEIFMLGTGSSSDIVTKQMYTFRTRGGDQLALRPEGTPPIMRAYFEHGMWNLPQPVKLYYSGSFFRHEAPQWGRYRELHQWGLELLGEENPVADAQVVQVFFSFFRDIGLKNVIVEVNSIGCEQCRPRYRSELTAYYRSRVKGLCKSCKERFRENPLRLLDCKEEKCQTVRQGAPQTLDHLCEACKKHFTLLLEFFDEASIPYLLNPYLVRGLDYYTRTVFEIFFEPTVTAESIPSPEVLKTPDGTLPGVTAEKTLLETEGPVIEEKEEKQVSGEKFRRLAIAGGGRYDNLARVLVGKDVAAVGGAVGLDRLMLALKAERVRFPDPPRPKAFFVQLGELARKKSFSLIESLRKAHISIAESLGRDSIKSQLKIADKVEAEFSIIVGQKEALDGTIILREMSSGNQEIVPQEKLIETLKKRLKK